MSKQRDPWFDNSRWLAGSLVVVIHTISPFVGTNLLATWLHSATAPLRLPLFVMLVGLFTPKQPDSRFYANMIRTVIAPFLLLTVLHIGLNWYQGRTPLFTVLEPQTTLWFLVGLAVWRCVYPLF